MRQTLSDYTDMAYCGPLPHIFISYSHADSEKVRHILRYMYHGGLRFWYDRGIREGDEWRREIDERLESSASFLLFLSNGAEQRDEVIRELRRAMALREKDSRYRIYVVLLERMPLSYVFRKEEDILAFLQKVQYIALYRYQLTAAFLETLLNPALWAPELRDGRLLALKLPLPPLRREWRSPDSFSSLQEENPYIYRKVFPARREEGGVSFYALEIGETDPVAVYPLCMDNQWCPASFYSLPEFLRDGFGSPKLSEERNLIQRREIFRALLHHWQVLVNRASMFNSTVFQAWYGSPGEDRDAFLSLMKNGSFVIYLMREKTPCEEPAYAHSEKMFRAWAEACRAAPVFCIRMDWQDEAHNAAQAARSLTARFRTLLLTTAEDPLLLDTFCDAMHIPEEQRTAFRAVWAQVRDAVIEGSRETITPFNREQVYRRFLLRQDGSPVTACHLDPDRPFVREIKQIVDFVYTLNLPLALDVEPMVNYQEPLWDFVLSERLHQRHYRTLTWNEVYCAILSFPLDFLRQPLPMPRHPERLTLSGLTRLRELPEWRRYMEAVEAGRKRARLNELDFQDIRIVWLRCREWLAACAEADATLDWAWQPGSLSVIYHLGNDKVIAVYSADPGRRRILSDDQAWFSRQSRGVLTIDFICGSVPDQEGDSCFQSPVRLFEGLLAEPARAVHPLLTETLQTHFQTLEGKI